MAKYKFNKKLSQEKEIHIRFKKSGKVEVSIYESSGIINESGYEMLRFKKTIDSPLLNEICKIIKK